MHSPPRVELWWQSIGWRACVDNPGLGVPGVAVDRAWPARDIRGRCEGGERGWREGGEVGRGWQCPGLARRGGGGSRWLCGGWGLGGGWGGGCQGWWVVVRVMGVSCASTSTLCSSCPIPPPPPPLPLPFSPLNSHCCPNYSHFHYYHHHHHHHRHHRHCPSPLAPSVSPAATVGPCHPRRHCLDPSRSLSDYPPRPLE